MTKREIKAIPWAWEPGMAFSRQKALGKDQTALVGNEV